VEEGVEISCRVRNAGERAGDEVVQLYLRDPVASVVRPERELKGFSRVSLAPGEECGVRFHVSAELLAFSGLDGERVVEPGRVEILLGASSTDIRLEGSFELTGSARRVPEDRAFIARAEVERQG